MDRLELLNDWVARLFPGIQVALAPASADASFRRYFRLSFSDGRPARIVMDAPPDKEDCGPFIQVASLLAAADINAPRVLDADTAQGFLLLTDLGEVTYLRELQARPEQADRLYRDAIAALVRMQTRVSSSGLPVYDRALLLREMALYWEWYASRHRARTLSDEQMQILSSACEVLITNQLAQQSVFVHRDYHSRNLMLCPDANPGVLDFQDAVAGPITYDLVSLLKDAYIEWEEERVLDWSIRYWEAARAAGLLVPDAFGDFYRDFEWMGLQRHLKVLGIFARLSHRDGKDGYLRDLPLVLAHVRRTCKRYSAFAPLLRVIDAIEGIEVKTGITF
ncbi:MAG: aminoglycoside phosphotransferase family protein [Burkholderiales bacterium]